MGKKDDDKKESRTLKLDPKTQAVFTKKGFIVKKLLNKGGYGLVYRGKHVKSKATVAIKVMPDPTDKYVQKFWPRELEALKNIRHEHVIRVYDIFESGHKLFIIMQYANCGDIRRYLKGPKDKDRRRIPEELTCYWFRQCLLAIEYMHDVVHVAHRDMKADNVLLHDNRAKVTDFGFAINCWDKASNEVVMSKTTCGTRAYNSPQLVEKVEYSPFAADAWAMGVLLFYMLNGRLPYKDKKKQLQDQMDATFLANRYTKSFPPDLEDLQLRFLEVDEKKRITMAQALKHPWIVRKGLKPSTP